MKVKLKLGKIGMNMAEAVIIEWHKNVGDTFEADDIIYTFETEKVVQDFEASASGTVLEVLVPVGEVAQVGQELCVVDVELPK